MPRDRDYIQSKLTKLENEIDRLAKFIMAEFADEMVEGSAVDNAINLLKMSKTGLLAAKAGKKLYNIEEIKNMIRNAFEEIVNDIDTNKKI